LHFLKGTPYVYQGEEIGMTNITVDSIDQVDDIEARNMYFDRLKKGYDEQTLLHAINIKGRDNARTPMQWDDSENAGFTTGKPWLPVNQNYKKINVHAQLNDPNSILNVYRFLINYRKNNPLVVYGDYQLLESHKNIFAYTRTYEGKTLLVVANISNNMDQFDLSKFDLADEVLIANAPIDLSEDLVSLPPYGAFAILAK